MKFAIYNPHRSGYYAGGTFFHDWKKSEVFLTKEDAEAYLKVIKNKFKAVAPSFKDLFVRQVE